ncbi:hypothetical protein CCHOA_00965 [Corynebacterium choanae]|uniref:HTH luxR-type domain-containing protein n=2 Tax=Corynebacterium choanae TaxID=1862358 RepID=A0A3G6J3H1_9CORY|nr:hypothetical protein CCHOA_00965 [Corynebacterium choanae]
MVAASSSATSRRLPVMCCGSVVGDLLSSLSPCGLADCRYCAGETANSGVSPVWSPGLLPAMIGQVRPAGVVVDAFVRGHGGVPLWEELASDELGLAVTVVVGIPDGLLSPAALQWVCSPHRMSQPAGARELRQLLATVEVPRMRRLGVEVIVIGVSPESDVAADRSASAAGAVDAPVVWRLPPVVSDHARLVWPPAAMLAASRCAVWSRADRQRGVFPAPVSVMMSGEQELVFRLAAAGLTDRKIARALSCSTREVTAVMAELMARTGSSHRLSLLARTQPVQ